MKVYGYIRQQGRKVRTVVEREEERLLRQLPIGATEKRRAKMVHEVLGWGEKEGRRQNNDINE